MGASVPSTLPVEFGDQSPTSRIHRARTILQLGAIVCLRGRLDESGVQQSLMLLLDAEPVSDVDSTLRDAVPSGGESIRWTLRGSCGGPTPLVP